MKIQKIVSGLFRNSPGAVAKRYCAPHPQLINNTEKVCDPINAHFFAAFRAA
jgi:hypothetical protein